MFQYLGWLLSYEDNDSQTIHGNLKKAQGSWARILGVLQAENACPRVNVIFYRKMVHVVLLFGSETWNMTPTTVKGLEGLHIRVTL